MHSASLLLLASALLIWISGCSAGEYCTFQKTSVYKWCNSGCCTDDCCTDPNSVGAWVYGVSVTFSIIVIIVIVSVIVGVSKAKAKHRVTVAHSTAQPNVTVISSSQQQHPGAWTAGASYPPPPPAYSDPYPLKTMSQSASVVM